MIKLVAIIPARGGSKRIPKKNIKEFLGIPMIERTISMLNDSSMLDKIIVSTEDKEISNLVNKFENVEIVSRALDLSDDYTPTQPVIVDAIKKKKIDSDTIVICIYPCTPLLKPYDIKEALNRLANNKEYFIFPIIKYSHPIQRAFRMNKNHELVLINKNHELTTTQSLEHSYYDAGQFYIAYCSLWLSEHRMHSKSLGYEVDSHKFIDIDNLNDWRRAEIYYRVLNEKN